MSKGRILVVDDNPTNLKLICVILRYADFEVATAADAEAALAVIASGPFNLILMDIALPGMDGLSLTRKLKADPLTRHIPIIALTASAMKGDEQKALAAGCDGYITKPVDTRELPQQISKYLPLPAGTR